METNDSKEERKLALERELRPQHLAFARALVSGENLTDAYMGVYDCSAGAARTAGSRLFASNTRLREYYSLCTGMACDSALATREALIQRLLEISENHDARAQGAAVAAIKEVLEQLDHGKPQRVEVSGPKGEPITTEERSKGLRSETVIDLAAKLFGIGPDKAEAMFRKGKADDADQDQA